MGKMKALKKTGPCKGEIVDIDAPPIADDECLVRIKACGICAWDANTWKAEGPDPFGPGITGHEMAGVVAEVGRKSKKWKPGDKVVIYGVRSCGACPHCRRRNYRYCMKKSAIVNGFAEYVAAPWNRLLPMPRGVRFAEASLLIDIVGTPIHGLRRGGVGRKTTVAVWGLGPVGLGGVQGAKALGAPFVIGVDILANRRRAAERLGADVTLDPRQTPPVERMKELTEGEGMHVCLNAVAVDSVAQAAYDSLRLDGTLVLLAGQPQAKGQLEKNIRGSWYFHIDEYAKNLRLLRQRKLKLRPIISHRFPLSRAPEAFDLRVNHPDETLKVVITM
ncbi:MAG: alcohol dehydrogenase catalytic domain-containing protein [Planctomycetes bacterium]|nr:alcohol dehydrogenase catalytic domain-containing protein [Planctomycetota bacterium]